MEWIEPDDNTPADQILRSRVPLGYNATDIRDAYLFKMCMSSPDPVSDPSCVVMVTYSGMKYLAYCKPGDNKWTAVVTPWAVDKWTAEASCWCAFEDVTYHKGNFYAVNDEGRIVVIDGITGNGPPSVRQVAPLPRLHIPGRKYLVGLPSGELLFLARPIYTEDPVPYQTTDFIVFKIDIGSSQPQWNKVDSLGEMALFLGCSSSVLISSSQAYGACRGNCIYFTDDFLEGFLDNSFGGHDMGVFDMESKTIERYYPSDSQLILPPPLWIMPNPSILKSPF